jgi:hypothetical protein
METSQPRRTRIYLRVEAAIDSLSHHRYQAENNDNGNAAGNFLRKK